MSSQVGSKKFALVAVAVLAIMNGRSVSAAWKTAADVPVSSVGNAAYLSSMPERPWWNRAWTRRTPLLVSSASSSDWDKAIIDVIVDLGEKVNPQEVRVVTPWNVEIPCVCEEAGGTKVELLFKETLRALENRPFFIYWGNPGARSVSVCGKLTLETDAESVRMGNGIIEIEFDNRHLTPGFIRRLEVIGSQARNELLERTTGFAWKGLEFSAGGHPVWGPATVLADNALKKSIRFECERATLDFTLYADQPRLDWMYALKDGGKSAYISVSWACAGGCAFDEVVYPGATGAPLVVPASLDCQTDNLASPNAQLTEWLSEGWFAVTDRRANDVVGFVFDREALRTLTQSGCAPVEGNRTSMAFSHAARKGETATGAGAIVATMGSWKDVKLAYDRLRAQPRVQVGRPQDFVDNPVRIARLDRDFCASFDTDHSLNSEALKGSEWATNTANRLLSLGATVWRPADGWQSLPIPKELYVRVAQAATNALCNHIYELPPYPSEGMDGRVFRTKCETAHAMGLAMNVWGRFMAKFRRLGRAFIADPEFVALDRELQFLYAECGLDCVYNAAQLGEGSTATIPYALSKEQGVNWLKWKNPHDFLRAHDENTERLKTFYREAKKRWPEKPVVIWNAENGEFGREMFNSEQAGFFDTVMVEMLPGNNMPHVKHVAKRMRALFDNEAGRTVHHHYYHYAMDYAYRVTELEMPFICGVNGFSHENLCNDLYGRDASEIAADFHRFVGYTGLAGKVPKMAPVKNLAVFRDSVAFRDDALNGRIGKPYSGKTQQDNRVHAFGEIENYNYDVVINRYFTKAALSKYNVVYVPEDPVFSDCLANELVAYVKGGGGAVIEGVTATNAVLAALKIPEGKPVSLGRGRVFRFGKVMTDGLARRDWASVKAVQEAITAVGGRNPYEIESKGLDSVLQSSDEGMFLAVYNKANAPGRGKVRLLEGSKEGLLVLDVKNGVRRPYCDGFEIEIAPRQCGFYLIGDESFTALPETVPGTWCGTAVLASFPKGTKQVVSADTNFTVRSAIEFKRCGADGRTEKIRRSSEARIAVSEFTKAGFDRREFLKALAKASYVHFLAPPEDWDFVFEDCADAFRAFLKRGGGFLFDRVGLGRRASAFLKDVGVFDPTAHLVEAGKIGDGAAEFTQDVPIGYPEYKPPQWGFNGNLEFNSAYARWDREHQRAPCRMKHNDAYAMLVLQEKVLDAGKVVFTMNKYAFTDFYENFSYGEGILSWLIGMPIAEHAKKVEVQTGGPGRAVCTRE